MEAIEWERTMADSRGARLFTAVLFGVLLGFPLLLATTLLVLLPFMAGSLLANPATLAVVVLLALIGGPMSLLYLWPLLTDPEQREGLGPPIQVQGLSRRSVVAAAVLGALGHVVALLVFELGPFTVLAIGVLVGSLGTWLLLTTGRIDPDDRTLSFRQSHWDDEADLRTVDLDGWTNLRRFHVGPVVVLWPSYARGSSGPRPRLLSVPPWVADAAAPVFEQALDVPAPERERETNPTVAAVLVIFGLGTFGVGAALWTLDVVPAAFRAWFAALAGVFGALFLAAAWRER